MAEELQRILECPMCLELFDSSDRWPKLLPCQHTFCRTCLVQLDKQGMIACPQCRLQHKSPQGGAKQLPNNFTMLALLDVHKKSTPSKEAPASLECVQEKVVDNNVQKAITELAHRLQQKAGELSSIDTKRSNVEQKFLAVKTQVDAAFESRARDLQIRKESIIKQLAAMRQDELNIIDTQKASAYQYLQNFQRDFAVMRESILKSQEPRQDQYNELLTVCQRYTQQIEQYALTIDENLKEITFMDPNRAQLTISINSYGVLQTTSMDKSKNKPASARILQLQTSTATVPSSNSPSEPAVSGTSTPSTFTRKLSTPEISMSNFSHSMPHTASSPHIQQDGSPSNSRTSSRSGSPKTASRNRSQTVPNASLTPVPADQCPITSAAARKKSSSSRSGSPKTASRNCSQTFPNASLTPVPADQCPITSAAARKKSSGSMFVLSGNPPSSSPASTTSTNSGSDSIATPQVIGQHDGEPSANRDILPSSSSSPSGIRASQNLPSSSSLPISTPSNSVPISRNPAAGDNARMPPRDKPLLPRAKPNLSSSTRHASIDFSQSPTPPGSDSITSLSPLKEQRIMGARQLSLSIGSNGASQTGIPTSPEGPVPPLPPRRAKGNLQDRPRSMSADTTSCVGQKDSWVKFDTLGSRSRKITKGRAKEVAVIGSGWFGGSFFERPTGVAVLPQNLLAVVDERSHCIAIVTEAGQLLRSFGTQGNGQGQFQFPKAICLNSRRQMIVSDWWNHRVQIWDVNGQFISHFGTRGSQATQFNGPLGVACDASDNIFVCDTNNHCVKVFSPEGCYLRQIGKEGHGEGAFICPSHLVVSPGGELLITDSGKHCVHMFSTHGTFLYQFGDWGTGAGQLNCPSGIMIDSSGYLFVSSSGNHRVEVYNPSGSFAVSLGTHGTECGQFDEPIGLAPTSEGQIVVCDSGNKRVKIMWP